MLVATINWAILLITKSKSLLGLWKYTNAMLICTSNYASFIMWQSGIFSLYLTGKIIPSQSGASKMTQTSVASLDKQWRAKMEEQVCAYCCLWFRCLLLCRESVEMCRKYAACPPCLFPKNKTRSSMDCSARCLEMTRVTACTVSVNLHNVNFFWIWEIYLIFKGLEAAFNTEMFHKIIMSEILHFTLL